MKFLSVKECTRLDKVKAEYTHGTKETNRKENG